VTAARLADVADFRSDKARQTPGRLRVMKKIPGHSRYSEQAIGAIAKVSVRLLFLSSRQDGGIMEEF
jgi:hypothetical protein